jgi:hypothetical protein
LSEKASDAESEALSARENKSDIIAGVDLSKQSNVVSNILIDLAQRDTKNMSTRFASLLVRELKDQTMLLGNTHRFAGFRRPEGAGCAVGPDRDGLYLEQQGRGAAEQLRPPEEAGQGRPPGGRELLLLAGAGAPLLIPELRSIEVVQLHTRPSWVWAWQVCHKRLCCHNLTLI